jgi:hypothetical protein
MVQGVLTRALGPAADEIGIALARWTSFRLPDPRSLFVVPAVVGADALLPVHESDGS